MRKLIAALAVASIPICGAARADDAPVQPIERALELAPSRCLDKKEVARQIQAWLGKPDLDMRISVAIEDAAKGVRFVVKRDGKVIGERTLDVTKVPCEEIHAALGLGIATAIDATILTSLGVTPPPAPPEPAPPEPPTPTPVASPAPVVIPAPAWVPPPGLSPGFGPYVVDKSKDKRKRAVKFTAELSGIVLIDLLPKVTLGVSPSAELSVLRGFDLRASVLATGSETIAVGVGTADVGLVAGRVDGCAVLYLLDDLARLRGCAGVIAGGVTAQGAGFDTPRAVVSPWVAPSVRGDARWSITSFFGVDLGVDGFFPGLKPELQAVDSRGNVVAADTFPLAGVGISLGPSVTF